jgi:ADP-ribose pyrophosphatase
MAKRREVEIRSRRTAYEGRYRIEEVAFDFDRATGKGRITDSKREIFERGDSAAALVHDIERDMIIATEQFRVATFDKGPGYLIEAMAGSLEDGEDPRTCIRREMMEEIGYRAGRLVLIARYYASPGSSSERISLFYAPVRTADLVDPEASGVAAEKEDIRRIEFPREDFLAKIAAGRLQDGKLVTAGLWLALQPRRGKPSGTRRGKVRRTSGNR